MPPDRVLMFPRETKLKIMTRDSLMNSNRPRVHRCRAPEVAELFRGLRHVADAGFLQARRPREIVSLGECEHAQIFRRGTKCAMLLPVGRAGAGAPCQK